MSSLINNATIKGRRDTSTNWTANNPTLNQGEWGHETDTLKSKRGDGSTAWTSLSYAVDPTAIDGKITGTTAQIAKAWVNFNGTGTVAIRSSFNVSSITDSGAGNYIVNFINALNDSNYAIVVTTTGANTGDLTRHGVISGTETGGAANKTTSACSIRTGATSSSGNSDNAEINVIVFGL